MIEEESRCRRVIRAAFSRMQRGVPTTLLRRDPDHRPMSGPHAHPILRRALQAIFSAGQYDSGRDEPRGPSFSPHLSSSFSLAHKEAADADANKHKSEFTKRPEGRVGRVGWVGWVGRVGEGR